MSVRSSDPCPRLTSVLLPISLARPTERQAEASTDKTSGWGLMLCVWVFRCQCLFDTYMGLHTHMSVTTHTHALA